MYTLRSGGWIAAAMAGLLAVMAAAPASGAIHTEAIEYKDGETVLEGYLAYDDSADEQRPGVLIVHEWWGLGEHQKTRARMLAELGYVAFALDMYGKGKLTDDPKTAGTWAGAFRSDPALARRRFEAGLKVLREHERTDPSRVAAIGYCFGGGICLEMARMGVDLDGVVSFHGNLSSAVPEEERKPITAKILVCHGADDPHVPPEQVLAFMDEMAAAGGGLRDEAGGLVQAARSAADWQLIAYGGAVHSFTNPEADAHGIEGVKYNERADRRSWEAMRLFLAEVFGEPALGLPSLQAKLDAKNAEFNRTAPAEVRNTFKEAMEELTESGILEKAVNVGDKAPLFALPSTSGETVKLAELLKRGPVVLAWYRGGWCPYCSLELPALQEALPLIRKHGATLVAISPETVESACGTVGKLGFGYEVLSDAGNKVAAQYGLRYKVNAKISARYKQTGIDLSEINNDDSDTLPLAATYLIDTDGVVRFAFLDVNHKRRAEPADIVRALEQLEGHRRP